jgi:Holliday junction resolvasome RuvABC endonuclease subunit
MTIHIGLDLSLVSPGICVFDTATGIWSLYGFAQRVRENRFSVKTDSVSIVLLPAIPNVTGTTTNEQRYEHIRHHIVDQILAPFSTYDDVVIGIECYAFGAKNSGSSYKLQELGGVIKHSIWRTYPRWRQEIIPPSQWKKKTLGKGHATKKDVVAYVQAHGPCVSLFDILGLVPTKNGDIPCPVQDLADAACICLSTTLPTTITNSKKRRRDVQKTSA